MTDNIGLASGSPQRKPLPTAAKAQTGGRFTAEVRASLLGKELEAVPEYVEIALLAKAPAPEGIPYIEFECDGYQRQKGRLVPGGGSGIDANMSEFIFKLEVSSWTPATHIAIMSADNRILFYGPIRQWGQDRTRANEIRFSPYELIVRHC